MSETNDDPLEGYYTKNGLIWKDGKFLDVGAADALAYQAGLVYAERVVNLLEFRCTPAGKCFQQRLDAAGPYYYGLKGKQRLRVESTVAELFHRQESGIW